MLHVLESIKVRGSPTASDKMSVLRVFSTKSIGIEDEYDAFYLTDILTDVQGHTHAQSVIPITSLRGRMTSMSTNRNAQNFNFLI